MQSMRVLHLFVANPFSGAMATSPSGAGTKGIFPRGHVPPGKKDMATRRPGFLKQPLESVAMAPNAATKPRYSACIYYYL